MCKLAGQHIGFITVGHCDQHIGIDDTGSPEHVGKGGMASDRLDIQSTAQVIEQIGIVIHQRNIISLGCEIRCNSGADLSSAQNQDFHCSSLLKLRIRWREVYAFQGVIAVPAAGFIPF